MRQVRSVDKEHHFAYVANGENGLVFINLTGIKQPDHFEPVLGGTEFNVPEQNLSSITTDDALGSVSILKTGDTPIMRIWTEQPKDNSGGLDCGYTYYAQSIDKNCEDDYSYFDVDSNGYIYPNDTNSLKYKTTGNMVPFSVYAENENGHKSNQAKVTINIQEEPEYTLKFQRSAIKVDQNISTDTPVANVFYRESQRELFLLGVFESNEYLCNESTVKNYPRDYGYDDSFVEIIEKVCTESTQFRIDVEGNLYINETLVPGIYTIHIIAVDRFGVRWLENQEIEVLAP